MEYEKKFRAEFGFVDVTCTAYPDKPFEVNVKLTAVQQSKYSTLCETLVQTLWVDAQLNFDHSYSAVIDPICTGNQLTVSGPPDVIERFFKSVFKQVGQIC